MTITQATRIREGYEPIPGYVLEEMIGRGGFGEVWRSTAPGGLKKAVKFVFGAQDASRGGRELRSLERIRGVQHPFLLALERFESIAGQLVIVTELADGSLEDLYRKHRESGSCGIPRELLLRHLHDTADALDYLHGEYKLQHLDIKPGNLLMIGGHVKVADFGLLKDLRDVDCSVVGGLTPIYAPPELFDGRPSMNSDQYSLAVMYQELLTGTRPFSGRTIAQLATQHVHSPPNLEPLPSADRPIVARALEKDPERRFKSCSEFILALHSPHRANNENAAAEPSDTAGSDHVAQRVEDLPQLDPGNRLRLDDMIAANQKQMLVVGLGGTGADCIREVRCRAAEQMSDLPMNVHSVLIDTDLKSLHSLRDLEPLERAPACELIYTPLKTAHEYRQNGTERLRTISRRWIYNVPKSGVTEGMRPLGRLALVDHGRDVLCRLKEVIGKFAGQTSNADMPVYVVGSISGGSASGMFIDLLHVLRHLFDDAGMEGVKVMPMLSCAPVRADVPNPLSLLATHAALLEIRHFIQPGNGYPGDAGAHWPSVPAARTPLRDLYVVADAPSGSISPPAVETIADYVWADATSMRSLLDAARRPEDSADAKSIVAPALHSVGVVQLGKHRRLEEKTLSPVIVKQLLVEWLGLPGKTTNNAHRLCDRIMRRIGITAQSVFDLAMEHVAKRSCSKRFGASADSDGTRDEELASRLMDEFAVSTAKESDLQSVAGNTISRVVAEISARLNDRQSDVTSVIECLGAMQQRMRQLTVELKAPKKSDSEQRAVTENAQEEPAGDDAPAEVTPPMQNDCESILARRIAIALLEQLSGSIGKIRQRCERLARHLAMAIVETKGIQTVETNPWEDMPEVIRSCFGDTVDGLHGLTANRFLVRFIMDSEFSLEVPAMVDDLYESALPLVADLCDTHIEALIASPDATDASSTAKGRDAANRLPSAFVTQTLVAGQTSRKSDEPLTVEEAIVAVKPSLLELGGQQRLVLVVGTERERNQFEKQVKAAHKGSLTVVVVPGERPKLIHEAQQIEIENVVSRLSVLSGTNSQLTGRLASRTDVEWK